MEHPNVTSAREAMSALAAGDTEPVFARMRDDIMNLNDIGAGPWREPRGKEAMMRFWAEWMDLFDGTFRQDILDAIGYDDRVVLIIHETGTAQNQVFDNRAVYLLEVDQDRLWTALRTLDTDLDHIHRFWAAVTLPERAHAVSSPNLLGRLSSRALLYSSALRLAFGGSYGELNPGRIVVAHVDDCHETSE